MTAVDPSESALYARMLAWATAIAACPTQKAHTSAPRPSGAYGTLNIISAMPAGAMGCILYDTVEAAIADTDPVEMEERIRQRNAEDWEWVFSINFYASDAMDKARRLINSLKVGGVIVDHLHPLAFRTVSGIRRLPELVQGKWENRAQFDVTVAGTVLDGFLVDVAEEGSFTLAGRVGADATGIDFGPYSYERP